MAELAVEDTYSGTWNPHPVQTAHSLAAMRLWAAEDHALAMCRLLQSEPVPVYGHVVLARAALEAAVLAGWLSEPSIGAKARVERLMTELLVDCAAHAQLADAVDPQEAGAARARSQAIRSAAATLGFTEVKSRKGAPPAIGERRPSMTDLARRHLQDRDGSADDWGSTMYRHYCSIAHANVHGLVQSAEIDRDTAPAVDGLVRAAFVTKSRDTEMILGVTLTAYGYAIGALAGLCGWHNSEWTNDWQSAFA
ncbi:MAG TPA: hypothetical protein VN636_16360, partial [Acidimicrobiia bacterium]|nr:hypothetical protein [Acidimicrobiia bacterium]